MACTVTTWTKSFISGLIDNFLKTFCWLPLKLANQNATTVGGGVVKFHVGFRVIVNLYFDWPIAKEPIIKLLEKCQKVVTNCW